MQGWDGNCSVLAQVLDDLDLVCNLLVPKGYSRMPWLREPDDSIRSIIEAVEEAEVEGALEKFHIHLGAAAVSWQATRDKDG